jgi:glycosyltransferase 2 family protein
VIVSRDDRARLGRFLDVTAVGQLLNYTAPLRAGDAYKLARLSSNDADPQGRFANVASALVLERVADILALVLVAGLALGSLGGAWDLSALPARAIAWRAGVAVALAAIVAVALAVRPPRVVVRFLRDTRETLRSPRFVGCVAVAIAAWGLDAGALWWTARSGGFAIAFAAAVQCVFVLNVGIAVPVTVANLGIFEATLAFALSRHAIGAESALVIATLDHFVILAGHVLCVAIVRVALWGRRL